MAEVARLKEFNDTSMARMPALYERGRVWKARRVGGDVGATV